MSDINIEMNAEIGGTYLPIQVETEISEIDEKIKEVGEERFLDPSESAGFPLIFGDLVMGLYPKILLYVSPKTNMAVTKIFWENVSMVRFQAKESEIDESDIEDDVDIEDVEDAEEIIRKDNYYPLAQTALVSTEMLQLCEDVNKRVKAFDLSVLTSNSTDHEYAFLPFLLVSEEKNQIVQKAFNENIKNLESVLLTQASNQTIPFSKLWEVEADVLRDLPSHPFTSVKGLEEALVKGFFSENQPGLAWAVSALARMHYFGLGCDIDKEKGAALALCANYLIKETEHKIYSLWDQISPNYSSEDVWSFFVKAHSFLSQIKPDWSCYESLNHMIQGIQNQNLIKVVEDLKSPDVKIGQYAEVINTEIEKGSIDAKLLKQILAYFFFFFTDRHLTPLEDFQSVNQDLFNQGRVMAKALDAQLYEDNKDYEKVIKSLKEIIDAPFSPYLNHTNKLVMVDWIVAIYSDRGGPNSEEEELMYSLIAFKLDPSEDNLDEVNLYKKEMNPEQILEVEQKVESWVKLHPIELEG